MRMGKGIQKTEVVVKPGVREPANLAIEVIDLSTCPAWVRRPAEVSAVCPCFDGARAAHLEVLREQPAQAELSLELPPPMVEELREPDGRDAPQRSASDSQSFYIFGEESEPQDEVAVVDFFI